MLDLSFWMDEVVICHKNLQFCNNKQARMLFCSGGPDRSTCLVLDVLFYQKEIFSRWVGHPLVFCFALVHVKGRGGWRSKNKWREEGTGDHNQQRERIVQRRRGPGEEGRELAAYEGGGNGR
jgi:hypothetical protein